MSKEIDIFIKAIESLSKRMETLEQKIVKQKATVVGAKGRNNKKIITFEPIKGVTKWCFNCKNCGKSTSTTLRDRMLKRLCKDCLVM